MKIQLNLDSSHDVEGHLELLRSPSKFPGPRKFTLRYQLFEIKELKCKEKIGNVSKLYSFDKR